MHRRTTATSAIMALLLGMLAACASAATVTVAPPDAAREAELKSELADTAWRFMESQNPITDGQRRTLSTDAVGEQGAGRLAIRCTLGGGGVGGLDLIVVLDEDLSAGDVLAEYRLDDQPGVLRQVWNASTDGAAAFASSGAIADILAGMTAGADTLRVRLYDYRGTPYDRTFNVSGFDTIHEPLGCRVNESSA